MSSAKTLKAAKEDIVARLKTIPNLKIFKSLTDEEELTVIGNGNSFTPYVVISFSGTSKMPGRYRAMTGARNSGEKVSIVVRSVGHTADVAEDVYVAVHDLLLGYQPEGCSEISQALYFSTGAVSTNGSPARYSEIQSYEMSVS